MSRDDWEEHPCWPIVKHNKSPYLESSLGGTRVSLHRIIYSIANGWLIKGLVINHLCENTNCINPAHLEQVSQGENQRWSHLTTVCGNGHEWTPENTYIRKDRGNRPCRECSRQGQKKAKLARKNSNG